MRCPVRLFSFGTALNGFAMSGEFEPGFEAARGQTVTDTAIHVNSFLGHFARGVATKF